MSTVSKNLATLTWLLYPLAFLIIITPTAIYWVPENILFFRKHELLENYGGLDSLLAWQQILGFFVTMMPAVAQVWAISLLLKLVRALKLGRWFDESSEVLCRRFGQALLWYVALAFLHRTLLVLIFTATYPDGKKELAISVSSNDLLALVPAIFALIFAHIVGMGRAQQHELKQII